MSDDEPTPDEPDFDHVPNDPEKVDQMIADDNHVLDPADLQYPELVFEDGEIENTGTFDLTENLSQEEMVQWLKDLVSGLGTHDLAVESPDGHVRFGVSPKDVQMQFDPDENGRGELEVTFTLGAKTMFVADDPEKTKVGARGSRGFIPIEQLTTDRETFRCYNWIDDPFDP